MNLFHVIEDRHVILRSKGVYRQAKVYRRDLGLYAGHGSGFIRLHASGGTSAPDVSWEETDVDNTTDKLGRIVVSVGPA